MARLVELLFFAIIIYMVYRRLALPFRRGYAEREAERRQGGMFGRRSTPKPQTQIDRSNAKDAEFKDIK
jgi:hypothetical protein